MGAWCCKHASSITHEGQFAQLLETEFGQDYKSHIAQQDVDILSAECQTLRALRGLVVSGDVNSLGLTAKCVIHMKAHYLDEMLVWVKSGSKHCALAFEDRTINIQELADVFGFQASSISSYGHQITQHNFYDLVTQLRLEQEQPCLGDSRNSAIVISGMSIAGPVRLRIDQWLRQPIGDLPNLDSVCVSPFQSMPYKGSLDHSLTAWAELQGDVESFMAWVGSVCDEQADPDLYLPPLVDNPAGNDDELRDEIEVRNRLLFGYLVHINKVLKALHCDKIHYRAGGEARPASFSDFILELKGQHKPSSLSKSTLGVGNVYMKLPYGQTLEEALQDSECGKDLSAALQQVVDNAVLDEVQYLWLISNRVIVFVRRSRQSKELQVSPPVPLDGSGKLKPLATLAYFAWHTAESSKPQSGVHNVSTTTSHERNTVGVDTRGSINASCVNITSSHIHLQCQQPSSCSTSPPCAVPAATTQLQPLSNNNSGSGSDEDRAGLIRSIVDIELQQVVLQSQLWLKQAAMDNLQPLEQLPLLTLTMLGYTNDCLGGGLHTRVFKGEFNGVPAALKFFNTRHITTVEAFKKEASAYARLSKLQGECIPNLLMLGRLLDTGALVLVLTYAEKIQTYTDAAKQGAIASLEKLHANGAVHGWVEQGNLLACGERVWHISLEDCKFDMSKEQQHREMEKLKKWLRELEQRYEAFST